MRGHDLSQSGTNPTAVLKVRSQAPENQTIIKQLLNGVLKTTFLHNLDSRRTFWLAPLASTFRAFGSDRKIAK